MAEPTHTRNGVRDRQELWHLESFLMVNGTTDSHRDRRLRLYRYLCDTCEHEFGDVGGWGGSPEGTVQCRFCNRVVLPDDPDRGALLEQAADHTGCTSLETEDREGIAAALRALARDPHARAVLSKAFREAPMANAAEALHALADDLSGAAEAADS